MTMREQIQLVKEYDEVRLSGRCLAGFDVVGYTGTVSTVSSVEHSDGKWGIKVWPDDCCLHPMSNGKDWFDEESLTELTILSRDEDIWGPGSNQKMLEGFAK